MIQRRTASIALSIVSFFCALQCLEISVYIITEFILQDIYMARKTSSIDFIYQISMNPFPFAGLFLLAPLCAALGIVLPLCSGRKVNPVHIAIWGSGVTLISIPTVIMPLLILYPPIYTIPFDYIFGEIAGILTLLTGIASIIFASVLYRHYAGGTLVELPGKAGQAKQNAVTEKPVKVKKVNIKRTQDMLERLWLAGLITEKEYNDKLKECAGRL